MLTFLGLIILVAGFFACHISPTHSYKLHRYEGQYLYLRCADLGLRCFGLAIVVAFLSYHCPSFKIFDFRFYFPIYLWIDALMLELFAKESLEASRCAWVFLLSALTFASTFLYTGLSYLKLYFRFGTWNSRIYVMADILSDSPLDTLLFHLSLDKEKCAMISMDDRKVYVGKIISLGEPSETSGMDQDIAIIPLLSGYRDKDTLKVVFTTHYDEVDAQIILSLRQGSIISATVFDFDAYDVWNPKPGKNGKGGTAEKAVGNTPASKTRSKTAKATTQAGKAARAPDEA